MTDKEVKKSETNVTIVKPGYFTDKVFWTPGNLRIFELYYDGQTPKHIAELVQRDQKEVLDIIVSSEFMEVYTKMTDDFFTMFQQKRMTILNEVIEELRKKVMNNLDSIKPSQALIELRNLLINSSNKTVFDQRSVHLHNTPKEETEKDIAKNFGFKELNK